MYNNRKRFSERKVEPQMSIAKKMLIKPGYRITVQNAPEPFALSADELPEQVEQTSVLDGLFDFVLLFAANQEELNRYAPPIFPHLRDDSVFWVAYPKKSSKFRSDISRDTGWESLQQAGYVGVSLVSLDDTWSAFRLRKAELVKKKS